MAARENDIGPCKCPVCGSHSAHLRVSVKQLAYIVCNACNVQIMARSDRSDEKLRGMCLRTPAPAVDAVRTAPALPASDVQTLVAPAPVPTALPAPPAKPPRPLWGFGATR